MTDELDAAVEAAKAAQEIAKTTGKAIDAASGAGGFFARFLEGPLEQASGYVEDRLRFSREVQRIRFADLLRAKMAERGMEEPTRRVPLNVGVPLLAAASLEEHEALRELWAKLLLNAADASFGAAVPRSFVSILENLSPLDAAVLDKMYVAVLRPFQPDRRVSYPGIHPDVIDTAELPQRALRAVESRGWKEPESEDVRASLWNIHRLGCIDMSRPTGDEARASRVRFTPLGRAFMKACWSPTADHQGASG